MGAIVVAFVVVRGGVGVVVAIGAGGRLGNDARGGGTGFAGFGDGVVKFNGISSDDTSIKKN